MSSTTIFCRACLSRNNRVYLVANTELRTIFQELTSLLPNGTPVTLCYICLALLQKCWKFKHLSQEANKHLNKLHLNSTLLDSDYIFDNKIKYTLSISTIRYESVSQNLVKQETSEVFIKEECTDVVTDFRDNVEEQIITDTPVSELIMVKHEQNTPERNEDIMSASIPNLKEIKATIKQLKRSQQKGYTCDTCGKRFKQFHNLKKHAAKHAALKPFTGIKCYQTYTNEIELHQHCDEKKELHICDTCGKAYVSKYSLQVHIAQKHLRQSGLNVYKCETCNKSFNHRGTLRLHIRIHTGDRPYSCDRCPKSFSQKGTLQRHYRMHTGEKPYACHLCTKTFNQESSLKRHIKMHNGEKPYACSKCNKAYYESSHLTRHMRTHTGEKPYACDRCFQTFSQSSNLHAHIKKHTGRKASNFTCHECNMTFDHRSIFNRHLLKHTQEKPYPCNLCEKKYADKRTLQRHILCHGQNMS